MQTIDTSDLVSLGPEGGGPWRVGESKLLRIASGQHLIRTEKAAREMLEVYRAAAATGAGTPEGYEVVRIGDGYGVLVEYVVGVSLGTHIAIGSYSPVEAGQEMGRLVRSLHGASIGVGRDFNALFCEWAHILEPLLPAGVGERLVALVEAVPRRSCLLHGDVHVGNMVVRNGRLALIDMESAGYGHPVFDLAVARSRAIFNVMGEAKRIGIEEEFAVRVSERVWESLLSGYLGSDDAGLLDEVGRRVDVLSEVERCCFAYGVRLARAGELSELQRGQVDACAARLAELLPELDRLDF